MIELETKVEVKDVTAKQVFDFMIECGDEKYQEWWPGTHFKFHTVKRYPGNIGNIVYFDELVGKRRIKSSAVIVEVEKNRKIVWQLKSIFMLPIFVELKLQSEPETLIISHGLKVGYQGLGTMLDSIFRIIFSEKFEVELNDHASKEFFMLAKLIAAA